ncbi:hypothetical protein [Thiothrix nivea]|uniref:hypothetical protein n=1 Tax=Thiothrix nivea TaxID=1031 RepID=UPI0005954167|nr:hypothetical protein [Thiothrix nivea]
MKQILIINGSYRPGGITCATPAQGKVSAEKGCAGVVLRGSGFAGAVGVQYAFPTQTDGQNDRRGYRRQPVYRAGKPTASCGAAGIRAAQSGSIGGKTAIIFTSG